MIELRQEPYFRCTKHGILLCEHLILGTDLRIVQNDQEVACQHPLPFSDMQFPDNAAIEVLNALAVAVDLYDSICNHGAVEWCRQRPGAESAEKDGDDQPSRECYATNRVARCTAPELISRRARR